MTLHKTVSPILAVILSTQESWLVLIIMILLAKISIQVLSRMYDCSYVPVVWYGWQWSTGYQCKLCVPCCNFTSFFIAFCGVSMHYFCFSSAYMFPILISRVEILNATIFIRLNLYFILSTLNHFRASFSCSFCVSWYMFVLSAYFIL